MKVFRVLIVDDKDIVLNRIKYEITPKLLICGEEWKIEVVTIHVNVQGDDNSEEYYIDDSTISNLEDALKKRFDLLLLDFGYLKKGSNIIQSTVEKYGDEFSLTKLAGKLLNPADLIENCFESSRRRGTNIKNIRKNFIGHKSKIIIYTYIPPKTKKYVPSTAVRENITNDLFPKANSIEIIDTSSELFNESEFEDKYDQNFYSYLVAKLLNKVIQNEISEMIIKKSKYIKVARTTKATGLIVLIGGLLGASSEFIGDLVVSMIANKQITAAVILTLSVFVVIVFLGKFLVSFLEKNLDKLFAIEE